MVSEFRPAKAEIYAQMLDHAQVRFQQAGLDIKVLATSGDKAFLSEPVHAIPLSSDGWEISATQAASRGFKGGERLDLYTVRWEGRRTFAPLVR